MALVYQPHSFPLSPFRYLYLYPRLIFSSASSLCPCCLPSTCFHRPPQRRRFFLSSHSFTASRWGPQSPLLFPPLFPELPLMPRFLPSRSPSPHRHVSSPARIPIRAVRTSPQSSTRPCPALATSANSKQPPVLMARNQSSTSKPER